MTLQLRIGEQDQLLTLEVVPEAGKKGYVRTFRPAQQSDAIPRTARWAVSSPFGHSREGADGFLGTDYATADHRWSERLMPPPKRNTVSLTAPSALQQYKVPSSDVATASWTEVGNGNATAYDELNAGIAGGTPNDATYWYTGTTSAWLVVGIASATDPQVNTGLSVEVRWRYRNGTDGATARLRLYQGATVIWESGDQPLTSAFATATLAVPETAVANITDFTTLRVGVAATALTSQFLDVSEIEVIIPDTQTSANVQAIEEDRGQLYVHRGRTITHLNPVTMAEVDASDQTYRIESVARSSGKGLISFGTGQGVKQRTAVSPASGGTTYGAAAATKAHVMRFVRDRVYFVDASGGANEGKLFYTFDEFTSVSNAMRVGDAGVPATGIGGWGPYAVLGREDGVWGFTDVGKSIPLTSELEQFRSSLNGFAFAEFGGWLYVSTRLGLRALIPGGAENTKAGPDAIPGYEGGISGLVVALFPYKGVLWAAVLSNYANPSSGTLTILRGEFNPQITPGTGLLDWYFVDQETGVDCRAFGATASRDNPTLIRGRDRNIAYYTLGWGERDIDDAAYRYQTGSHVWYGTTLQREPNVRKTFREAGFRAVNCDPTNTINIAVSFDDGDYVNVGTARTNGLHVLRPMAGARPSAGISGLTMKPQVTITNSSETTPPQLRGYLDVSYDLLPTHVEQVAVPVRLTGKLVARLERFLDPLDLGAEPILINIPGDPATPRYGRIVALHDIVDDKGDGVLRGVLDIDLWASTQEAA